MLKQIYINCIKSLVIQLIYVYIVLKHVIYRISLVR